MAIIEIRDILNNETGETIFPRTHVNAVIGLKDTSFFEAVQDELDPTKYSVKLKSEYTGLWAEGWMAAGGVGEGSGGGGGSSTLSGLLDVYGVSDHVLHPDGTQADDGDALRYDLSLGKWVASPVSGESGGVALSLSSYEEYLLDSNGNFLLDSTGKFLATANVGINIELLDSRGNVLSSVPIPLSSYVPTSRTINGHPLTSDIALSAVDDLGVAEWAMGGVGDKIPFSILPDLYTVGTKVTDAATKGNMLGVNAISNDLSSTGSESSLIKWENGAWHFYGNIYADGWIAAGGIGNGGEGGVSFLRQLSDVYHGASGVLRVDGTGAQLGDALIYNDTLGWLAAPVSGGGGVQQIKVGSATVSPVNGLATITNPVTNLISGWFGENFSITRILSSGTAIATVQMGNVQFDLYAPSGGGGGGGSSTLAGLSDVSLSSPSNGQALVYRNGVWNNETIQGGGGSGSVTSVAMTVPTGLSVSGSPITTSGTLAVSLTNGYVIPQQATLDNFVTLDGTQTITGAKTFSSFIDIGNVRLVYDQGTNALHITKKSGTQAVGLYADGFVAAGGVSGQTTSAYVDLESDQTVGGNKTFTGTTTLGNVVGPVTLSGALNGLSLVNDSNDYVSLRASRIDIQDNGNNLFLCRSGGKVFLCANPGGTVSQKLYLDSSSTAIAQSWNTHSDVRLKKDIATISEDEAIRAILALNPVSWRWKDGGGKASGLIAQEVEKVIPFIVTDGEYKGLAYQMFHAYELSAIQSHEGRIRTLEMENKELRETINRLSA